MFCDLLAFYREIKQIEALGCCFILSGPLFFFIIIIILHVGQVLAYLIFQQLCLKTSEKTFLSSVLINFYGRYIFGTFLNFMLNQGEESQGAGYQPIASSEPLLLFCILKIQVSTGC